MACASLRVAAAPDTLARALYAAKCEWEGSQILDWSAVPYAERQAYLELGMRLCRAMTERPTPAKPADNLFRLATDLARAQWPIGGKVVGVIDENRPWGEKV